MTYISEVRPGDERTMRKVQALLEREGITLDANLDGTVAVFDDDDEVIASGSCFMNTLRCFAVDRDHHGEGLMNMVVSRLMELQMERGNMHLFVYTKCDTAPLFRDLGFHEIARAENRLVFLENRRAGFDRYLSRLQKETVSFTEQALAGASVLPSAAGQGPEANGSRPLSAAAIVMNANPFTLGHLYLVERACAENDLVHLFTVSEDVSLFPRSVRHRLIRESTAHLGSIVYHETGPYMISNATFPSYFLRDRGAVIDAQARLDAAVFTRIAEALGIRRRYVGEEPFSAVTAAYNRVLTELLPQSGIGCAVIPRACSEGAPISASAVREALQRGDLSAACAMVPPATAAYLRSDEATPVLDRIRKEQNVTHY